MIDFTHDHTDSRHWGQVILSVSRDPRNPSRENRCKFFDIKDRLSEEDYNAAFAVAYQIAVNDGDIKTGCSGTSRGARRSQSKFEKWMTSQ